MRILLDNNVIPRFALLLPGHEVSHARQLRWQDLQNGDLIAIAETEGFAAIITADKNLRYQKNIKGRKIAIIVLNALFIKWPYIEPLAPQVLAILDAGPEPGAFVVINPKRGT